MPNSPHSHDSGHKADPDTGHKAAAGAKKVNLTEKITYFIFGFILALMIIAVFLKFAPSFWGGVLGSGFSAAAGTFSLKRYQNDLTKKIAAIGMICAVGFLVGATILIFGAIQLLYMGVSS